MSRSVSPSTGRVYGLQRACKVLEIPRSTVYHHRRHQAAEPCSEPSRRGPRPAISDSELLALIRADLDGSPFQGEGHRKVWARLRFAQGVRVSPKRVLRLMRDNLLLSPHRSHQGEADVHDGRITTDEPGVMWGTDGSRVLTVEDGWVWLFTAVEHWNAECVGWYVCKDGNRYNALEPIAMGLQAHYDDLEPDVARGLALRMDHGSQYLSDHFLNQVRYWGIRPSFAFVSEPETNGVAERFNRTIKEQAIHGRVFQTIDDVRAAVDAFVNLYNHNWRVEKLGFLTPHEARQTSRLTVAA